MKSEFPKWWGRLVIGSVWCCASAYGQTGGSPDAIPAGSAGAAVKLPPNTIEQLVAPIALYPDVLLAQVLPAATFPMDVVMAARWLRTKPDMSELTEQPWDPSVLSLCHYPDVINKLDADLEWTNALGAAFLNQQQDVMNAIQALRAKAKSAGALASNAQQVVVVEQETIRVVPAEPQVVYVPQYDPQVVYVDDDDDDDGDMVAAAASAIGFTAGLAMGAWLDMDCDWHAYGVAYCRPGYWGGYAHRGVVAWGDDWAAAVGPRRAAVVGEHGGAYVGPRGAAVWGDNGHGAAWRRPAATSYRPAYTGRYASYNQSYRGPTNVSGNRVAAGNEINVDRSTNVNVDRGDRTAVAGGDRTKVQGDRTNVAGGESARANRSSAFSSSGGTSQTRESSERGKQSREARGASQTRSPQPTDASRGSKRQSSFSDSRGSRETQRASQRGGASRGGGGRRGR